MEGEEWFSRRPTGSCHSGHAQPYLLDLPVIRYVNYLIHAGIDDVNIAIENMKQRSRLSESGRVQLYSIINPHYVVHAIYKSNTRVNELERVSWTRLRVSGHSLAVEEGRWNRRGRGRLPMEERLCSCGQVQTERHVIEQCPRTMALRQQFQITTMENLFLERRDDRIVCRICHEILSVYS